MNKKVTIKKNNEVVQFATFDDEQVMNKWIEMLATTNAWGSPHIVINHPEIVIERDPLEIEHEEVITPNPDLIIHHEEVVTLVADLIIRHEEIFTSNPDLIIHHEEAVDGEGNIIPAWDESVAQPDTFIPAWDEVIPQPPTVTPAWDEVIPQPPTITSAWTEFIPRAPIVTPAWTEEFEAEYTIEIVDISAEVDAKDLQRKYDYLWKAANDFQSGQISGAAIGLLTIGVLAQKPKCTAVQAWIKSVWVEYYTRKAGVSLQNNVNLDFSICGNIPYTVPELMEEVSI